LHCVSAYPTNDDQANLLSIPFLRRRFKTKVGYSDHTIGTLACLAAVALGATIIEKHFSFDKTQPFGDHVLSADPEDLRLLIQDIRRIENMLGSEKKICQNCESFSKKNLRRSLHAQDDIPAGTIINNEMIISLISGKGLSADQIDKIVEKKAARLIKANEAILETDII
jgi:sialic acid synthase SpsE